MIKPVSDFTPRRAAKLLHLEQEEGHRGTTNSHKQLIGRVILHKSPIDAIYATTDRNLLELVALEQLGICIRDISCGTNPNQSAKLFLFTSFHVMYQPFCFYLPFGDYIIANISCYVHSHNAQTWGACIVHYVNIFLLDLNLTRSLAPPYSNILLDSWICAI